MTEGLMANWKKICLWGLSFGVGFSVTLVSLIGLYVWHENQPKPPKPWNTSAIVSTFDYIDTEGNDNTIVFYYTIQNNTDYDYELSKTAQSILLAKLEKQNSLSGTRDDEFLKYDKSVYVPAKQRLRFAIHLRYPTSFKLKHGASEEEKGEFRRTLSKYLKDEASNLNGFVLFDEENRYQIDFAKGW